MGFQWSRHFTRIRRTKFQQYKKHSFRLHKASPHSPLYIDPPMWKLDLTTFLWSQVSELRVAKVTTDTSGGFSTVNYPGPRAGHFMVNDDHYIYVYGGFTDANELADLWAIQMAEPTHWKLISDPGDDFLGNGSFPSARYEVGGGLSRTTSEFVMYVKSSQLIILSRTHLLSTLVILVLILPPNFGSILPWPPHHCLHHHL